MLLRVDAEAYEHERLLVEQEEAATAQAATTNILKEATMPAKETEEPRLSAETKQLDLPITQPLPEVTIPGSTTEVTKPTTGNTSQVPQHR